MLKTFQQKHVSCVARDQDSFRHIVDSLARLGYDVSCQGSVETAFAAVTQCPSEWAMVVVRLDQPLDEKCLEKKVYDLRRMDADVPVLLFTERGRPIGSKAKPNLYSDYVVKEPSTSDELIHALFVAAQAKKTFGTKFNHFLSVH